MSICAKMGGKSLDRGSIFGAMSQLSQCRKCVEYPEWFAESHREAEQAVNSTSLGIPQRNATTTRCGQNHSDWQLCLLRGGAIATIVNAQREGTWDV